MTNNWTHSTFSESLNTSFALQHPQWGIMTVELVHVSELRETPRQRMFSLVFRGPLEQPLQQGTFPVAHEKMGEGDLFLVPIGRETDGFHYEAVFNNMVH